MGRGALRNPRQYGRPIKGREFGKRVFQTGDGSKLAGEVASDPTPDWEADWGSATTAETGDNPAFVRASDQYYFDTGSTIAKVTSGNAAFGTQWGDTVGEVGVVVAGPTKNSLLYSEDFTNAAWVATNMTPTGDSAVAPDGNTTADTLTAGASPGYVTQDTGLAASGQTNCAFSVFVKTASGTVDGEIRLYCTDESATPVTFTATTSWQRVAIYKAFTGAATGNVSVDIQVDTNTEAIYAWGAMYYPYDIANPYYIPWLQVDEPEYVKTTSAAAVTAGVQVNLTTTNDIPDWETSMTFCGWMQMAADNTNQLGSGVARIWGSPANYLTTVSSTNVNLRLNNTTHTHAHGVTWSAGDWVHWACAYSHDGSDFTYEVFINGASVVSNSTTLAVSSNQLTMSFGSATNLAAAQYYCYQAPLRKFRIYNNQALAEAQVLDVYNDEKDDFRLHYGYPASSNKVESDVVLQWIFDESSGDIVDEVASLSASVTGSPTYSVEAKNNYELLSPGITTGSGNYFSTASSPVDGLDDYTIEAIFSTTYTAADMMIGSIKDPGSSSGMYLFYMRSASINIGILTGTYSAGNISLVFPCDRSVWADGKIHKLTMTLDRDGNGEIFLDTVSLGSGSVSPTSAKSWPSDGVIDVGNYWVHNLPFVGTLYELRASANLTNRSPSGGD